MHFIRAGSSLPYLQQPAICPCRTPH